MRRIPLRSPFTGGMVTDRPAWELAEKFTPFAQDGYSPSGVFKQRGGWEYDGTTADVADNLVGVYRAKFVLADVTRTLTGDDDGDLFIHNASAAGTSIFSGTVEYLPRCVYNDELIFCAQDGQTPLVRYSGASVVGSSLSSGDLTAGEGTITGIALATAPDSGAYVFANNYTNTPFIHWIRILAASTSVVTLEGCVASANLANSQQGTALLYGKSFPCVNGYSAGTITVSGNAVTGYGTLWATSGISADAGDAILIIPATGDPEIGRPDITGLSEGSGSAFLSDQATKSPYMILRAMPFKDVAHHNGSVWGSGFNQFPSRVYVGPPGWNISFPPGTTLPFDISSRPASSNPNDFLMDFIDVPGPLDGDPVVAILPSPGPLLVLKRNAVHGIFGSYPSFSQSLIADGIGCIDIRSAHSYDEGQFWAGEGGIYWYTNGQVRDLTAGRINREWRALTRDFDYGTLDYCTLGLSQGHLIVHITTGGGNTQRTYICDLRDGSWQSRISNFTPRYMFTSRIPGEEEKLLAVSNDRQGRVLNFSPALNGSGTAKDDAGSAPRLQAWTPEGIDGSDIDDDTRLLDLAVHANVYDATSAGATNVAVSVVTQDALTEEGTVTTDVGDIASDTTDRLDRAYFRNVNKRGRRHQVRLEVDTLGTDTAATKVEVAQIDLTFRGTRNRT